MDYIVALYSVRLSPEATSPLKARSEPGDIGVPNVGFYHWQIVYEEHLKYSLLHVKEKYDSAIDKAYELSIRNGISMTAGKFFSEPEQVFDSNTCMIAFHETYVTIDGSTIPCCYINDPYGNYLYNNFDEVWFGEKYKRLRHARNTDFCKRCLVMMTFDDFRTHLHVQLKDMIAMEKPNREVSLAQYQ